MQQSKPSNKPQRASTVLFSAKALLVAFGAFSLATMACASDVPDDDVGSESEELRRCRRNNNCPQPPVTNPTPPEQPPAQPPAATEGEPAELAGITDAHNRARAAENAGLPALTWDPALAKIAAAWGAKCQSNDGSGLIDHNPGRSNGYPTYVGENIYGTTGTPTAAEAVKLWVDEKSSYNYASNQCSGVCGHYTQVVWKATTKVGCAISRCANIKYGNSIICDYGPGGNFNGQRPY
jgi:pathogenesis-related protein 1